MRDPKLPGDLQWKIEHLRPGSSGVATLTREEWDYVLTALSQQRAVAEWQPIATAPRRGREMILLLTPSRWPQVAYSNTWWTAGFSVECKPTHWMPLPAVPEQEK